MAERPYRKYLVIVPADKSQQEQSRMIKQINNDSDSTQPSYKEASTVANSTGLTGDQIESICGLLPAESSSKAKPILQLLSKCPKFSISPSLTTATYDGHNSTYHIAALLRSVVEPTTTPSALDQTEHQLWLNYLTDTVHVPRELLNQPGSYAAVIALLQDLPLDEVGRQYGEEMVISHFSREEQLVSPTPSASTSAADVRVVQKRKNPPVEADKLVVSDIPLPPEKKAKLTVGGIQLGEKLPPPIPRLEYGRIKELLACLTIKVTKALVQHQLPFVGLNGQRLHDPSQPRFKDRKPQGRRATMEGTTADQSEWRYDPSFRDSYRRSHEDSLRREHSCDYK